jgi:hypothetical protein
VTIKNNSVHDAITFANVKALILAISQLTQTCSQRFVILFISSFLSMLQYVACCITLQYLAVPCSTLQYIYCVCHNKLRLNVLNRWRLEPCGIPKPKPKPKPRFVALYNTYLLPVYAYAGASLKLILRLGTSPPSASLLNYNFVSLYIFTHNLSTQRSPFSLLPRLISKFQEKSVQVGWRT